MWLHRDFTPQPQAPAPSPGSTGEVALDGGHEERQAGASCFCGPHISTPSPTYLPLPGPAPEPGGPACWRPSLNSAGEACPVRMTTAFWCVLGTCVS